MNDIGVTSFERAARQLDELPQPTLEQLERQTIAFLYAIWRARGVDKRIVTPGKNGENGRELRYNDSNTE
jgi:hypothetical protein